MEQISAVIIVKNEEQNIARCLKSISWVEEIVVLDTGSTDETVNICKNFGAKVYYLDQWEGFGKAKQQAVDLATFDWILSIDADEEISPELADSIQQVLKNPSEENGYRIKRQTWFLNRWIKHCGWNKDYPLRLFRKSKGRFNDNLVHESVQLQGKCGVLKTILKHYSYPTLDSHQEKLVFYARLWAEQKYEQNKQDNPCNAFFQAIFNFFSMYILKLGFLDGSAGFILCYNSTFSVWYKHIKLWELHQQNR